MIQEWRGYSVLESESCEREGTEARGQGLHKISSPSFGVRRQARMSAAGDFSHDVPQAKLYWTFLPLKAVSKFLSQPPLTGY